MKRFILPLSLVVNLIFIVRVATRFLATTQTPNRSIYIEGSKIASAMFATMPSDDSAIIFLGTSLTERYNWPELFRNLHIKNRGISGNTSVEMAVRIRNERGRACFIEAGLNDIIFGISADSLLKNIDLITAHFRTNYLYSILPTSGKYDYLNSEVIKYNGRLKSYAESHQIPFIDTYSKFMKDGRLDDSLTIDGAHLNAKGYQLWTRVLRDNASNIL